MESSKLVVGEWLDIWLNDYKRPELRPTTWDSYEMMVRVHLKPAIGGIKLKDLRPEHLQHLYNEKAKSRLSATTVRYIHAVIHAALKQAVKNGLVVKSGTLPRLPPCPGRRRKKFTY